MREIDMILVHCSSSSNPKHDDISVIKKWHLDKGWSDCGYHAFIKTNGELQTGRPDHTPGAHCEGYNKRSLAVCLSGGGEKKKKDWPTTAQLKTLELYLLEKCQQYDLEKSDIYGHEHFDKKGKTCPDFPLEKWLNERTWH